MQALRLLHEEERRMDIVILHVLDTLSNGIKSGAFVRYPFCRLEFRIASIPSFIRLSRHDLDVGIVQVSEPTIRNRLDIATQSGRTLAPAA